MRYDAQRFPFVDKYNEIGEVNQVPYLPLTLIYQNRSLDMSGLLDTGSTVNVLPYELGLQLGAIWDQQKMSVSLAGNLARIEARGLLVSAIVGQFATVNLAFA